VIVETQQGQRELSEMSDSAEDSSDDLGGEIDSQSSLSLIETGLRITDTELIHEQKNGDILQRWPLKSISAARAGKRLNPFSMVLIGSAAAIVYVALSFSIGFLLAIALYVLALLAFLLGLLMLVASSLHFVCGGQKHSIPCDDSLEIVEAFAGVLRIVSSR
jgi:hypothetical protein